MSSPVQYILYNEDLDLSEKELMKHIASAQLSLISVCTTRMTIGQKIPLYNEWSLGYAEIEVYPVSEEQLKELLKRNYDECPFVEFHIGAVSNDEDEFILTVLPPFDESLKSKYLPFLLLGE